MSGVRLPVILLFLAVIDGIVFLQAADQVSCGVSALPSISDTVKPVSDGSARKMNRPLEVKISEKTLRLNLKLPPGMKINRHYAYNIEVRSADTLVVKPHVVRKKLSRKVISIPVTTSRGETKLEIDVEIGYCRAENETTCFVGKSSIEVPVKITESGGGEFEIDIDIP